MENIKNMHKFIIAGLLVLILLLPFLGVNTYLLRVVIMIGIYTTLALALNLVTGYTGQVSLGNAAFYAIGAYVSAIVCIRYQVPFFAAMMAGAFSAGLAGFILGLPTLRLSGTYLSITTLGFCEVVRMILLNWDSVTNGPLGISRIPRPSFFNYELTLNNGGLYYLMIVILLFTFGVCWFLINSKIGRAFIAIREDEMAATLMGIQTTKYKVLAFTLSAFISGIAGSYYAHMIRYIDPNTFTFDTSILIISIVILGGMGTLKGMFLGAALLISFPEMLRFLAEYRFIVYGLILVIMMRFRPQGILGGQSKGKYRLPASLKKREVKEEDVIFEG